ncbi:MAG: transporter substrate-binding domain-containing protein [Tannerellaceae bacterium]|nr:transporter substrate-binding domain-containing protein [Tannerellaceae bacterium]
MQVKKLATVYIILLLLTVATMAYLWWLPVHKPTVARDYPEIASEGILRITTEYDQAGYYVDGDTIADFQYELAQAIANLSGLEVQIILEMNLQQSFGLLQQQQADIIARNIPVMSESKESYLFTDPIVFNRQILIQRTAEANQGISPIRNQLELAQKTIYIPKESPVAIRLQNLALEIGDTIHIEEEELYSSEQLIIMVARGEIDYAVTDFRTALTLHNHFPEIDIDTDVSFTQLQSWYYAKTLPSCSTAPTPG